MLISVLALVAAGCAKKPAANTPSSSPSPKPSGSPIASAPKANEKKAPATNPVPNYIMLVGGDADKFTANEKTIDEIWGSFGMYSGGSSGNS